MKFDCGISRRERLEKQLAKALQGQAVFAFFPVRIAEHDCRWLEWVWRSYPRAFIGSQLWLMEPKYQEPGNKYSA